MATNDFLVFGGGAGANVITQVTYSGLTARTAGFSSGVAQSAQLNKVWRQSSIMAAVLAQFISDRTTLDVLDDGTTATILTNLKASAAAVNGDSAKTFSVAAATASNHAVNLGQFLSSLAASGYIKIPTAGGPLIIQWGNLTPSGGAQTASLPVAFPNNNFSMVGQFSTGVDAEFGYVNISPVGLTQYRVVVRDSSGALLSKQVRWYAIGN